MGIQCPKCGRTLTADAPQGLCAACLLSAALHGNDGPPEINPFLSPTTPGVKPFAPTAIEDLRPLFPGLELISLLGYGGMGAVYKAKQTKLDRIVALKVIRSDVANDPTFAERFNREARTMARLSHPGLVAIHDFGEVQRSQEDSASEYRLRVPVYYFVMEYVDGTNLRHAMNGSGLSTDQSMMIVSQLCDALQYAHDGGVVHRDIKPENILLDQRGRVKIADFGLAKLVASDEDFALTGTHQVMGTPRYMAPEQMEGSRAVDHRADIYSVGVVFYEMLTGQVPAGHFDPPSHTVNVDPRVDSLVLRAMARDPERRFQTATDLRTEVSRILSAPKTLDGLPSHPRISMSTSGEPSPQALSEFLSYEARALGQWITGGDQKSNVPFSARWIAPLLAIGCFISLFFPCLNVTVTEPRVQLVSSPLQIPADFPAGILAGACLLGVFVIDLTLLNTAHPSRRLAVVRVSLVAVSILLLLMFRISIGAELVQVNFETGGSGTIPVPLTESSIQGNSGSGRAFLNSLRKTTELTPYGVVVAGTMLGLLVLSVISLKSSVATPVSVHGVQKSRGTLRLSPRELAARLMTIMGVLMLVVAAAGFVLTMFTKERVSSDADLESIRLRGLFLAGILLLNTVFGTIAIASGLSLLRGNGLAFARVVCVTCMLFCTFSILTTWPLAIWSLFVLNRISAAESGKLP